MSARPLFGLVAVAFVVSSTACSGEKVQTPTSDKNYDDEGAPGQTNDPGASSKDGGKDGARDAPEASAPDAAPEAGADAASD
jgi:hypothetical protein